MSPTAATLHGQIPLFFLYGEQRREIGPRFLHLESLEDRSKPSGWNIRPHAHTNLHHVFWITQGSGAIVMDGATARFTAPCLLLIPAGTVHGVSYTPPAAGRVLTLADAYLAELTTREPGFSSIFAAPRCLPAVAEPGLETRLEALAEELNWTAPGHAAAVEGHLLGLMVLILRLLHHAAQPAQPAGGRAAALVASFRTMVEREYRNARPLSYYAAQLHLTQAQLRRACLQITRQPPVRFLQDRLFLEAQRLLLYTNTTVTEAAHHLGFEDSAYFTRFFTKRAGCSPRDFRCHVMAGRDPAIHAFRPRK